MFYKKDKMEYSGLGNNYNTPQKSARCADPMPSSLHQLRLPTNSQNVLASLHPSEIVIDINVRTKEPKFSR